MKTTLAFAMILGLVAPLGAIAAEAPDESAAPAQATVSAEEIRELAAHHYKEGVEATKAGKLTQARRRFQAAFTLDPTHAKAKIAIEAVEKKLGITDRDKLKEKLEAHVATVEFTKAPLVDVVNFLAGEAKVNIVFEAAALKLLATGRDKPENASLEADLEPETDEAEGPLPPLVSPRQTQQPTQARTDLITIRLRDVPLKEVLKYVLRMKGLTYIVEDYAILIVPIGWVAQDDLVTEVFHLSSAAVAKKIEESLPEGSQVTWR